MFYRRLGLDYRTISQVVKLRTRKRVSGKSLDYRTISQVVKSWLNYSQKSKGLDYRTISQVVKWRYGLHSQ